MNSTIVRPSSGAARSSRLALVPKASFLDTVAVCAEVFLPTLLKGVIFRRRAVMGLAERLDFDRRAVRRMQRVRDRYGPGPLLLRIPGRLLALILDPDDVHRVLQETPEPFATASVEKRAALAHFEPKNVLLSHGEARTERRRFNEEVLDTKQPMHRMAERFLAVVNDEAQQLRDGARRNGDLTWGNFSLAWFRIVRRVVFGDAARDDTEISEIINRLRSDANWAFLGPQRPGLRRRLFDRIQHYIARAEPGSLAALIAQTPATRLTAPEQQVPQWIFAFDPAGMTTLRSLALLASPAHGRPLPDLRATILESLRLWPTSPLILRDTTAPTEWSSGLMPTGTGVVIYSPFFHRDDERVAFAHRFTPELWTKEHEPERWPLIPFSEGPAVCPGRNLVLLLTTSMLGALLRDSEIQLIHPRPLDLDRLPGTLNHFGLRFSFRG